MTLLERNARRDGAKGQKAKPPVWSSAYVCAQVWCTHLRIRESRTYDPITVRVTLANQRADVLMSQMCGGEAPQCSECSSRAPGPRGAEEVVWRLTVPFLGHESCAVPLSTFGGWQKCLCVTAA